jgi:hypothetical protein
MREYLRMERGSSMDAVCDHRYDIYCQIQWNIHGAHKPSMRTWNHMVLAASCAPAETSETLVLASARARVLTRRERFRYAREETEHASVRGDQSPRSLR